jgi:hypothetical protein
MNQRRYSLRWIALVIALGCPILAACGGSIGAPSGTVTNGANSSPGGADPALEFARCMRSNGVSNFPDPRPGGGVEIPDAINPQSPAFQSAKRACKQFLPDKGGPPPATAPGDRQAAFAFARCMRRNGVPDFPDPALSPPAGASRVLVLHDMVFAVGAGLDPKSPAFSHAMAACGVGPPSPESGP